MQDSQFEHITEEFNLDSVFYVALPVNEITTRLDVKPEVIVTILSKGEELGKLSGNSLFNFHNMLPEICNIRFYNKPLSELKKEDPIFEAIEKIGIGFRGVFKIRLLDLAEELNISPLLVPRLLFQKQCEGKITYEAVTECFCLEIKKITNCVEELAQSILKHMWSVETNTVSKLMATYILCRQYSYPSVPYILSQKAKGEAITQRLEKASAFIHSLHNVYFNSLEEECETVMAGSAEEKEIMSIVVRISSTREKTTLMQEIEELINTAEFPLTRVDVLKILIGIGTKRLSPLKFNTDPCWAKYFEYDHEQLIQIIEETFARRASIVSSKRSQYSSPGNDSDP